MTAAAVDPIDERYAALGGAAGPLGAYQATVNVTGGRYKQYANGRIYSSQWGTWEVLGRVYQRYLAIGASDGVLGFPSAPPAATRQSFAQGLMVTSPQGTYEVRGGIFMRYVALGEETGKMGAPLGPERPFAWGAAQQFVNGWVWWSSGTGAWETFGAISQMYVALGGPSSSVGFPMGGEKGIPGGSTQPFQFGTYWWSPTTGAVATVGPIDAEVRRVGGSASPLGFPTGAQQAVAGGLLQPFQGGDVASSSGTGTYAVWGAIRSMWLAYGGVSGILGFPTGPETGSGGGSYQRFGTGTLWWSAQFGTALTWGILDSRYREIGGNLSVLGTPTGAAYQVGQHVMQNFVNGHFVWTPGVGAWEVSGPIMFDWGDHGALGGWYGFPVGPEYSYNGGRRQDFKGGSLLSGVAPILDVQVSRVTAADVWATWRPGCPVGPDRLRLVRLNYWSFDGKVRRGEIIVRDDMVDKIAYAFRVALDDRFPIRQMWREDYWGGDNVKVMAADNTSAFNCRTVVGNPSRMSPHAYGTALDINTYENPYLADRWYPNADYADRGNVRKGMLFASTPVVVALRSQGFKWGASFVDYQHFDY